MSKYHISEDGVARVCNATVQACSVKGPAGMEQFHGSKEEVQDKIDNHFASNFVNLYTGVGANISENQQRLIIEKWKEKLNKSKVEETQEAIHVSASGNEYTMQAILDGKGNFNKQHIMQRINLVNKLSPGRVSEEEKIALLDKYNQEQKAKWTKLNDDEVGQFDGSNFGFRSNTTLRGKDIRIGEKITKTPSYLEGDTPRRLYFESENEEENAKYATVPHIINYDDVLQRHQIAIEPKYEKRMVKGLGQVGYAYHLYQNSPIDLYYRNVGVADESQETYFGTIRMEDCDTLSASTSDVINGYDSEFAFDKGANSMEDLLEEHKKTRLKRYTKFYKDENKAKEEIAKEIEIETHFKEKRESEVKMRASYIDRWNIKVPEKKS